MKTHFRLLALLVASLSLSAFAAPVGEGYYWGKLDDGRAMGLKLTEPNAQPVVIFQVEGSGYVEYLDLTGSTGQTLNYTNAMRSGGERWPFTGLALERARLPQTAAGRLLPRDGTNSIGFVLSKVAQVGKFSRAGGVQIAGRGGSKKFRATWPNFDGAVPLHRDTVKLLSANADTQAGEFTKGSLSLAWEGFKAGGGNWSWAGELGVDGLAWFGTNLVSLYQLNWEDTGGAHGNSTLVGRNFVLLRGKARELALKDLFDAGAKWEDALSAACLRELRRQRAASVLDGSVKGFKASDLESFTLDRRGLTIHFGPYAVGSFADGIFAVFIPWSEIQPLLDPEGPASLLKP